MKKSILFLCAAMMLLTACNGPEMTTTNYLPIVHNLLGMTEAQSQEYMAKNNFKEVESRSFGSSHYTYYEYAPADSSVVYGVSLSFSGDKPISSYQLWAELATDSKLANKIYNDWTHYAYYTIFNPVFIWGASVYEDRQMKNKTNYIDGSLKDDLKSMIEQIYQEGNLSGLEHEQLLLMFEHNRNQFNSFLKGDDVLDSHVIYEGFAGAPVSTDVPLEDILDLSAPLATIEAACIDGEHSLGCWFISFSYDDNGEIYEAVDPFELIAD